MNIHFASIWSSDTAKRLTYNNVSEDRHSDNYSQHGLLNIITPYIRMLSSDCLMKGVPYFTDDRSIFFFLNTLASINRPHRPIQGWSLKNLESLKINLDKNDDFVYSIPWICCRFFFWIRDWNHRCSWGIKVY